MRLREFKAKYMAILLELKEELEQRYPDRAQRVDYIVDVLMSKLENLRTYTLSDYLHTLYLTSKEFREFKRMVPSKEEIEQLLRGGEE
jgi:hypothetical protein